MSAQRGFQAAPLSEAIIYELHVGTFTADGTYAAAQSKLAASLQPRDHAY